MNLQYGAVLLAPDDVIVAATDGLGDVLDPIAANVPPKEFGLKFAVGGCRGGMWGACVVHVWCMCGVCGVYVWCMCGACGVYVWCVCGVCGNWVCVDWW